MPTYRHAVAAAAAAALACMVTTAPALAAPRIVHKTPKVPVVVNGHHYKPQQIHRFDGRPLYSHMSKDGKTLIAWTSLERYKTFLAHKGVHLPTAGKAHTSGAGQAATICTDRFGQGWCLPINSGWGVSNFAAINGCNWWGNCWRYENNIDWISSPVPVLLFDYPNFGGSSTYLSPGVSDLYTSGWSNKADSIGVAW